MNGTVVRQWNAADDRPLLLRLRPDMACRFVGTYWYSCPFRWHRHVFHDGHVPEDVFAASARCETPECAGGQLEFPLPPMRARRVGRHELVPAPSVADHHYGCRDA